MNRRLIYTLFSIILFSSLFLSYSGGYDGNAAGAPNEGTCSNCHSGASNGSVTLANVPAQFLAGQTYPLTLTIQHPTARAGGFQIVATNGSNNAMIGTFTAASGSQLTSENRLTHNSPKPFSGGNTSWTFNWTAPSDNISTNVVFYYVGNATNRDGGTSGDAVLTNSSRATIPVELLYFRAEKEAENNIRLLWSTASERNNATFIVQKSGYEQKFDSIGTVKGNGTSAEISQYEFTDNTPLAVISTVYYRLRQVDFDGKTTYSKTISVDFKQQIAMKIYPTLAKKGEFIHLEAVGNATIDILDISGRTMNKIQTSNSHTAQNATKEMVNINTSDLPTGRYFVRILGSGLVQTASFIVF